MTHRRIEKKAAFRAMALLRAAIFAVAGGLLAGAAPASAQVISNVAATDVTNSSAVITWTTNVASGSQVNYGTTTGYGSSSLADPTLVTAHSVTLTGLTANTLYNFDVVSVNTSANFAFATLAISPVIANINVIYITGTSATINWTTDQPANAMVNYGTTTSYGSSSQFVSTMATAQSVTLNGLSPSTTYNFDVVSAGLANVNSISANQTFTTPAASATAPNVGFVASWGFTNSSAMLSWSTDVPANTLLAYGTTTSLGQLTPVQTTLSASHGVVLTGLVPGTTYYFVGISTGTNGAAGYSPIYSLVTTGPVPLNPVVSNVAISNLTTTSATISWTTNVPSTSQVNYGTTTSYGFSSPLNSSVSTAHSVTLTGLLPGTLYDFQLVSVSTTGETIYGANLGTDAVWAWGDSLTLGYGDLTQNTYPLYLTTYLGTPVANEAVGGTTSTQIAAALLATPAALTPGNCNLIWSGGNNHNDVSTVLSDIASMVNALDSPACYLVLGDINSELAPLGTTDYNNVLATNESLATQYGKNYLNIRELLVQDYNPALALDQWTYANDIPANSLHAVRAQGTITSGALDSTSCAISVSAGTNGVGTPIIIDSETILINAIPDSVDITACTRGYNGTAAASHAANATYSLIDQTHLGSNGYEFVAQQVAAWFDTQFPWNFTTPGTNTTPPPVITAVTASSITSTSAVVTWTTDQPSSSLVNFGTTTGYGSASTLNPALVTAHSVAISGLTAGTTYDFDVVSANSGGISSTSSNSSFMTTAQASTPPVVANVATSNISQTSVTVTWTTDQPSSSLVNYGTTTGYGSSSGLSTALVTAHSVTLTGLTAGTAYDFDVVSANAASQSTTSSNSTVTTTAANATPPYVGYVVAWGINNSGATVTWSTDVPATAQMAYGTTTALGQLTPLQTAMTASHGVTLTGLISGTTYYFVAQSTGANGATGYSAVMSFTTTGTAPAGPPVISNVAVSGITNTSATITWTTDQASSSLVNYGVTSGYGSASPLNPTLVTSHSVTLTGLTLGTTYGFDVVSANAGAMSSTSGNSSFLTTSVVSTPPVISNVAVSGITNTSATITWTTDQASSSLVNFGVTSGYGSASPLNPTLVTSHSVTLTGLTLGTTYDFDVVSANLGAMSSTSANATFTTTSVVSTPPVITNVATTNLTSTSVTVTWTTDQASSSQINYGTTTGYGTSTTLDPTLVTAHSETITGLTAGTAYDFDVTSANAASQSSTSPNSMVTTTASTATPPYVGYVAAWGINNTGATVTWSTDVLANAQLAYGTTTALGQLSPLQTAMTASHGVTLTGLNPGTEYYFVAQSTGADGATGYSAVMTFTTTGTQTTPPPVISNVVATSVSNASETITWTTDQATSSQVNYGLSTTYTNSSTLSPTLVTSHSVTLTGLAAGATYDFDVMSADSSAVSSTSANSTFTTTGSAPPPVISNVSSSSVTSGTATIAWTTDQASTSVVNYGATTGYGSSASVGALVTAHSVTLTGLAPNTAYDFDVASANAANATTTSTNYTFTTTSNSAPPPVISYLSYWGITASEATITWSTNEPANTAVAYGTTNALGQLSPVQTALADSHGVTLTGLNSGTTYYFVAQSADGSGNTGYSTTYSFTTLAGPPTISGVTATPASNNTATVNWTTSVPTTSYVQYGLTTGYGYYSAVTSLTAAPHCALTYVPNGTVHYQLVSTDANGNQVVSPDMTFVEP
ncbi:MAG: fibronectin type III domain-containing protein [Acidobacteriaceae bacterium]